MSVFRVFECSLDDAATPIRHELIFTLVEAAVAKTTSRTNNLVITI